MPKMDACTNLLSTLAFVIQLNLAIAFTSRLSRYNTALSIYGQSLHEPEAKHFVKMWPPHMDINATHVMDMEYLDQRPLYAPAPEPLDNGMPFVPPGYLAPAPDGSFSPGAPGSLDHIPGEVLLPSPAPAHAPTPAIPPTPTPAQALTPSAPGLPPIYIQLPPSEGSTLPASIVPIIVNMPTPLPSNPPENEMLPGPDDLPTGIYREGDRPDWYPKSMPWPIKTPFGNFFPFTKGFQFPKNKDDPIKTPWGDFFWRPKWKNDKCRRILGLWKPRNCVDSMS